MPLIRALLDYAVEFWCPSHRKDIDSLAAIQGRLNSMIQGLRNLPNRERQKQLDLQSSEIRRLCGDLIEASKWIKGIIKGNLNKAFILKKKKT